MCAAFDIRGGDMKRLDNIRVEQNIAHMPDADYLSLESLARRLGVDEVFHLGGNNDRAASREVGRTQLGRDRVKVDWQDAPLFSTCYGTSW